MLTSSLTLTNDPPVAQLHRFAMTAPRVPFGVLADSNKFLGQQQNNMLSTADSAASWVE